MEEFTLLIYDQETNKKTVSHITANSYREAVSTLFNSKYQAFQRVSLLIGNKCLTKWKRRINGDLEYVQHTYKIDDTGIYKFWGHYTNDLEKAVQLAQN